MKATKRRLWPWLLTALLAPVLALFVALWSAGSAGGLAWLGQRLAGLQLEGAEGSLWQGLRAERLRLALPGLLIEAEGLDWQPAVLGPRRVEGALQLRRLRLTPTPDATPSAPLTEARLRESLRLPIALRLAPLRVERFEWAQDGLRLQQIALREASLADGVLQLQALSLQWPRADGLLQLQGEAALAQQLRLQLRAALPAQSLQAELQAEGPLARLPARLQLRHGDAGRLDAEAELQLFAAQPLRRLNGRVQQLDPRALHPALPAGRWEGQFALQPQGPLLQLRAEASNAQALRLDQGGWPLRRLQLELGLAASDWTRSELRQLDLELGNARAAAGRMRLAPQQGLPRAGAALSAQLRVESLRLSGLHAAWPALQLGGALALEQARLGEGALSLRSQLRAIPLPGLPPLAGSGWRLDGEARLQGAELQLQELLVRELDDSPARLQASGRLRWAPAWELALALESKAWRSPLPPWSAPSQLDASARLQLARARPGSAWTGQLKLQLLPGTRLAEQALQGEAEWLADAAGARWQLRLDEGPATELNQIALQGRQPALREPAALGRAEAWWPERLRWTLPRLGRLQALAAPWLAQLQGSSQGELEGRELLQGSLSAQGLRLQVRGEKSPLLQLDSLQGELRPDRGLLLQLQRLQAPGLLLREAKLDGSLAEAGQLRLRAVAEVAALREQRNPPRSLLLEAGSAAPQRSDGLWRLSPLRLRLAETGGPTEGPVWLELDEARADWRPEARQLMLASPRLRVAGEPLQLQEARAAWPRGGARELVLRLEGQPRLAPWLQLAQPDAGWSGDLRASLRLALQQRGEAPPQLQLALQRQSGDLGFEGAALGLDQLLLELEQSELRALMLRAQLAGSRLGRAELDLRTAAGGEALQGTARLDLPALEALQPWLRAASPGLLLAGSARAELQLAGSLTAPRARGTASAALTRALHAPSGIGLARARLRLALDEERLRIEELAGEGLGEAGGTLAGEGELRWQGLRPDQLDRLQGQLQLRLERLRLLQRFDRRLVASGELRAELLPRLLRVRGRLAADEGAFDIGRGDAPTLDEDVRVLRQPQGGEAPPRRRADSGPRLQRDLDLSLDLGQRLRIAGRGLSSRLTGQLRLVEQGGRALQATGLIELNGGRYRAYGQNLEIETGLLRFTGALDNPRLDILAIRPNLEQRVGVQVTGTADSPRVRLYSEPEMADSDKLAWLLLGRAPDELGRADTAILQRAALALLAGEGTNPAAELMDKLGLTELSLSQSDDAGTTLRLGAQLGRRWTLGYERSLDAATGSWQLVYRLGQRFRLRAQSGEKSAVDLLWLWRFD